MFFFLPINTDAPIYHFPWATLSMILANCLVFIAMLTGDVSAADWSLQYGEINALQWVTSNFIHGGFFHLLGNMFFLWGFGLIVEGKIGWPAFLAVYFGIGITECALEQVCMLSLDGASFGASSIIFGLTAMALVWAPKNEVSLFYFFFMIFIRTGVFDVTIMAYALFALTWEVLVFAVQGFQVGTAALHLLGAIIGLGLGVLMLKRNLVDCEGWDLFSVMQGTHGNLDADPSRFSLSLSGKKKSRKKRKRSKARMLTESGAELPAAVEDSGSELSQSDRARMRILRLIAEGKPRAALTEMQKQQHRSPSFQLERGPLRKLVQGLIEHEQWNESITLLEEYLSRFDRDSDVMRVQLALLLVQKQRRPRAALKVLDVVNGDQLSPELQQRARKVRERANQLIESGVIELSGRAFSQP